MPLSEHEERMLAEIERGLSADDPRFVQRTRRVSRDQRQRRLRLAAVGFVLGVVSLLSTTFSIVFGVIGFALMFVSVVVAGRALSGDDSTPGVTDRLRQALRRDGGDRHPS